MNNYNDRGNGGFNKQRGGGGGRSNFGGGERRGGGGDRRGGSRDDRPMQKFAATCAECGKHCEVPFRPSGDKPVLCSDCFSRSREEGDRGSRRDDRGGDRPRHDSFGPKKERHDRKPEHDPKEILQRLTIIESRLNRILDLINPPTPPGEKGEIKGRKPEREKKTVDAPALTDAVTKAVASVTPEKAAKKTTKKVTKKVTKKTTKTVAKKAAKTATKKVAKKATKKTK